MKRVYYSVETKYKAVEMKALKIEPGTLCPTLYFARNYVPASLKSLRSYLS
ncbi:hypothetical protein K4S53_10885 [Staphylococcus epidermidis]|uniref:hypothetical protein n=1 Tax=Staphylococcus epidermidis TaxID=1282 RepID=UPI002DBAC018|nr:hypothetical protein [Staphylococcus epidermidis]MCG1245742.1 hypothetical protein [Staphylococcus epidermidis]MCG1457693.1 hypothetical protein [Staphylococcus epidermidis]MCG1464333.1 hypothetical protein [Staphylococcus epidermidis]MCG1623733.1 hypothetical protein [Staphylococcus epidermidis]MCG1750856.1 hypothetical protein [Staphylococcus epidermidis]